MKAIRIFFNNNVTWIITESRIYFSNLSYVLKGDFNVELFADVCRINEIYFEQIF